MLLLLSAAQVTDDYTVIGRNLFKKETNLQLFVGLKVTLSTGETGVIEGGFGQSGKFKIRVQGEVTRGVNVSLGACTLGDNSGQTTEAVKYDGANPSIVIVAA